jgi:hypothetical protein
MTESVSSPEVRVCPCHGRPMLWSKDARRPAGGFWRCRARARDAQARYLATAAGRDVYYRAQARYEYARSRRRLAERIDAKRARVVELTAELMEFRRAAGIGLGRADSR